jgi:hypothetical protein
MMYDLLNMAATAQLRLHGAVSRRLIAALAICTATAMPIDAAEIKAGTFSNLVIMEGNIETGDYEKLRRFIEEHVYTNSLYLASPGGNVAEAIRIGRLVRALYLETEIPGRDPILKECPWRADGICEIIIPPHMEKENYMCASACFFVFVAGVHRITYLELQDEPILGVHRPFFSDNDLKALSADEAIGSANRLRAFIESYLKEMDVPAKYAELIFSVPKDQNGWVTGAEFKSDLNGFIPVLKDWMDARCDKHGC